MRESRLIVIGYLLLGLWALVLGLWSPEPWREWVATYGAAPLHLRLYWLGAWGVGGAHTTAASVLPVALCWLAAYAWARQACWAMRVSWVAFILGFLYPVLAGGMLAFTVLIMIRDGYSSWYDNASVIPLFGQVVCYLLPAVGVAAFLQIRGILLRRAQKERTLQQ